MKAFIEIELRGDDVRQIIKLYSNVSKELIGFNPFGSFPASGWVAEITCTDPKFKYKRKFLKCKKDYSRANSKGSRGVYAEYILDSGKIYEVKEHKQRYFCKVNNEGNVIKIGEEEVQEWLKNIST